MPSDRPTAESPDRKLGPDDTRGVGQNGGAAPSLFDVVREPNAPGWPTRVRVVMHEPDKPPVPGPRGPGRRTTSGPADAGVPAFWLAEAEAHVLALVDGGRTCCTDDLHRAYDTEQPGATGHGYGRLFASMAERGLLREVGWQRSERPEARGRRVVLWASGEGR